MPNWVVTKLYFHGKTENVDAIFNLIKNEEENMAIDFRKIIPMPDNIYIGDLGEEERQIYGTNNWYDWSIENWGTKWNSSESVWIDLNGLSFQTAWAVPIPILEKLAEICKQHDVTFSGIWCDEDWFGGNAGLFEAIDGELDIGTCKNKEVLRRIILETWNQYIDDDDLDDYDGNDDEERE